MIHLLLSARVWCCESHVYLPVMQVTRNASLSSAPRTLLCVAISEKDEHHNGPYHLPIDTQRQCNHACKES